MSTPTPRTNAAWEASFSPEKPSFSVLDVARTLERELAEATAEASHYMAVAQKATDELIFFRADNLKAHQMTCVSI